MIADNLKYKYAQTKFYIQALYLTIAKRKWYRIQEARLVSLLRYAQKHSQYYRELIGPIEISHGNALEVLRSMPSLTKEIIQKDTYSIYSDEITKNWDSWRNTGGSTGEPLKFPSLASPFYMEDICQMMLYQHMGYHLGDTIVSIDGSRVEESSQKAHIYWKDGKSFPYGKKHYSVLYLNEETFPYYYKSFCEVKPCFLRGYPSGVLTFCKLLEKSKQNMLPHTLKGVYLTSEYFSQEDKDYISEVLDCPVYGQYGHTECSVFAIQEPDSQQYLCNSLYGYTEVLNDKDEQVGIGETGEIVVTGFSFYGLPFIRYRTGDLAVYGGETKYGEVILSSLMGRTVDFIYNVKGEKVYTVGFIFGGHLKAFNYIKSWQIEQNEIGIIIIRIVKASDYNDLVENEIVSFFENGGFRVNIIYVDNVPKTNRGKMSFLIQNISSVK